eukprot:g12815.t1
MSVAKNGCEDQVFCNTTSGTRHLHSQGWSSSNQAPPRKETVPQSPALGQPLGRELDWPPMSRSNDHGISDAKMLSWQPCFEDLAESFRVFNYILTSDTAAAVTAAAESTVVPLDTGRTTRAKSRREKGRERVGFLSGQQIKPSRRFSQPHTVETEDWAGPLGWAAHPPCEELRSSSKEKAPESSDLQPARSASPASDAAFGLPGRVGPGDSWMGKEHIRFTEAGDLNRIDAHLHGFTRADLNQASADGCTPLHHATYYGCHAIVEFLCEKRVDLQRRNRNGATPLMHAAQQWPSGIQQGGELRSSGVRLIEKIQ